MNYQKYCLICSLGIVVGTWVNLYVNLKNYKTRNDGTKLRN